MKISKKLKRIASLLSVGVLIFALTGCTAKSNADNEIIKYTIMKIYLDGFDSGVKTTKEKTKDFLFKNENGMKH